MQGNNPGIPEQCSDPVFIVGSSRSGTTWVQSLLCLDDDYFSCPETKFFQQTLDPHRVLSHYRAYPKKRQPIPSRIGPDLLEVSFDHMDSEKSVVLSGSAREALRRAAKDGGLDPAQYLNILMYALRNDSKKGASRWIEKTPRHILFLDDIFGCFSDARVICIYRDPVGAMLSAYTNFKVPFLESLMDINMLYAAFERFMKDNPDKAGRVFVIRYEELKDDASKANEVLRFLGSKSIDPAVLKDRCTESFFTIYGNSKMASLQPQMVKKEGSGNKTGSKKAEILPQMMCRIFAGYLTPGVRKYTTSYPRFNFSDYLREGFVWFFVKEVISFFVFHARVNASYAKARLKVLF